MKQYSHTGQTYRLANNLTPFQFDMQAHLTDWKWRRLNGPYYAYLWGHALRRYLELPSAGHMIATNLHANTYDQARVQVCGDNQVPAAAFRRVNLLYFLAMDGRGWNTGRRSAAVWESNGGKTTARYNVLTSALPMNKFIRMVNDMEESFLITESWARVRGRIESVTK